MNVFIQLIYIARNAKDVCTSLFHFIKSISHYDNYNGTFEEFCELFLRGQGLWLQGRYRRRVFTLLFRDSREMISFVFDSLSLDFIS